MTAFCQSLPGRVVGEMLQDAARALCDRAGDTAQQRESRGVQMMLSVMALAPRDGFEVMLATLAFGHGQMILDSMSDALHAEAETLKARTKTTIMPLGRAMLGMLKELRLLQQRPLVGAVADTEQEAAAETQPPQSGAAMSSDGPAAHSDPETGAAADPGLTLPEEVVARHARAAPAAPKAGSSEPSGPAPAEPQSNSDRLSPINGSSDDPNEPMEEHIVPHHDTLTGIYLSLAQREAEIAAQAKAVGGD